MSLRAVRADLHQLDPVAIRVRDPRLPVVVDAEARLDDDPDSGCAQPLDVALEIVGHQAEVGEGPLRRRAGLRAVREQLDEAVAAEMQVDQHQGAVLAEQPERFADAELLVESQAGVHVMAVKGGVGKVNDHRVPRVRRLG